MKIGFAAVVLGLIAIAVMGIDLSMLTNSAPVSVNEVNNEIIATSSPNSKPGTSTVLLSTITKKKGVSTSQKTIEVSKPQNTGTTTNLITPVTASNYGIQTKTRGCIADQALPDSACTPGAIITTDTATICAAGYATSVRDVSDSEKQQVFAEYGISWDQHNNYEVDHLVSLELGGSNDITNLWPESYTIKDNASEKDQLEDFMHYQVCRGIFSLQKAQQEIAIDWLKYNNDSLDEMAVWLYDRLHSNQNTSIGTTTNNANPETKKSVNGLCHEMGTTYYDRTTDFIPYNSLKECLDSGGSLPGK